MSPRSAWVPLPARLSHRPTVGVIGREIEAPPPWTRLPSVCRPGEGREVVLLGGEALVRETGMLVSPA